MIGEDDMDNANTFIAVGQNGEAVDFSILFTYDDTDTGYSYIVYTDDSEDEEGNVQVYVSRYWKEDGMYTLEDIETEEEFNKVQTILDRLVADMRGQMN